MGIKKIYKGSSDITANFARVYRGSELIWEKETDPIYEDTTLSIDLSNSEELSPYLNIFKENDMLMTIDWGDGTTTTSTTQGSQDLPHTYNNIGEYIITITTNGNWYFNDYCLGELAYNKYLMTANLSNSVTSIGTSAFRGCTSLTSIVIPDSVTSIGGYAFRGCTSLTSIVIPDSVIGIGSHAFRDCTSLEANEYDNGLYLGNTNNPFLVLLKAEDTSISTITINSETKLVAGSAFESCSNLTSIVIPDSITSIGSGAFYGCSSLTSISIPNSVTSLGDSVFYGCSSLTSIVIPNSVTSIGIGIIDNCTNLTDVYFAGTTETWIERFGTKGNIFYFADSAKTTVIVQCSNGDVEYEFEFSG